MKRLSETRKFQAVYLFIFSSSAVLIVAATVLCINALAHLNVAEDFSCWCLSEPPAPGSEFAQPSLLTAPLHFALHCSPALCKCPLLLCRCRGGARICCCTSVKLALLCCCCCCRCCCCCLVLSIDGPHLIQDRLQDCLICCALCYPSIWINVQEVLPDAGSTRYKDMLAVLALHLVLQLVCPVFQLNDHDMIPLLPLFSRHFEFEL